MVILSLCAIAFTTGVLVGAIILSTVGSARSNERTIRQIEQRLDRLHRASLGPEERASQQRAEVLRYQEPSRRQQILR